MSSMNYRCGRPKFHVDTDEAKPYDPSIRFEIGDTIEHKTFGLGVVIETYESGVDVHFQDSQRRLVHGRCSNR